ncbi:uncharacterized protein LOC142351005 isoform X2 [Convolutriloba macropyga]|uniref:uncharacterized protein LOC142351005 isoform X2 n=1 Tax=Convolutriloba macropyga TaxID=536237 RepID=UPI003F51F6D1
MTGAGPSAQATVAKSVADVTEEIVKNATKGYEPGSFQYTVVESMTRLTIYAFTEPAEFLIYLVLILSPLILASAFCAYRLTKVTTTKKGGKKPTTRTGSSSSSGKPERQMPPRAAKKSKKDN